MNRYPQYKLPVPDNLLEPDLNLQTVDVINNIEFKSRYFVDERKDSRLGPYHAHRILCADFLHFVHTQVPFQIHWVEIFPIKPNSETVIVQEVPQHEDRYAHNALFILTGGATWNLHNITGYRKHDISNDDVPDYYPNMYAFTKPGQKPNGENWLTTSEMPILESYTKCAFIGSGDHAHSVSTDDSPYNIFYIISFEIEERNRHKLYEKLTNAFSPWTV